MTDARNIALSADATAAAEHLKDRLDLRNLLDVVRLAIGYAIRNQVPLERDGIGALSGANYNVGSVDTGDELRELVGIFYDDPEAITEPYRSIETLMNKGLLLLKKHFDDGTIGGLRDLGTIPGDADVRG